MKENMKPILFNTDMVEALLTGQKTVLRLLVKPRYRDDENGFQVVTTMQGEFVRVEKLSEYGSAIFPDGSERFVEPPYKSGDILYVRETWRFVPCQDCKASKDYPCYMETTTFENGAGPVAGCFDYKTFSKEIDARWYPSIHMPKKAARIFRKVKTVKVERLQEITDAGARAEGVEDRAAFSKLWDTTVKKNELAECGWKANPWVWVIEFEPYDPPAKRPGRDEDGCLDGQHSGLMEED